MTLETPPVPAEPPGDEHSGPPLGEAWGLRFNRALLLASLAVGVAFVLYLASAGAFVWWILPLAPLMALYVVAGLLLVQWLALAALHRLRRRGPRHPALPFFTGRSGTRSALIVLLLFVGAITALREGWLGEPLINVHWQSSTQHVQTQSSSSNQWSNRPDGRWYYACQEQCRGDIGFCHGFLNALSCDDDHPERPVIGPRLTVSVSVEQESGGCLLVPLFKSSDVRFRAQTTFYGQGGGGESTVHGMVSRETYGFSSCHAFDAAVGRAVAEAVATQLMNATRQ